MNWSPQLAPVSSSDGVQVLGTRRVEAARYAVHASLDILWLRDESLEDGANLPDPDVLALEIFEDLRAALEEFELIGAELARVSDH
jgi:hypothetical protein